MWEHCMLDVSPSLQVGGALVRVLMRFLLDGDRTGRNWPSQLLRQRWAFCLPGARPSPAEVTFSGRAGLLLSSSLPLGRHRELC